MPYLIPYPRQPKSRAILRAIGRSLFFLLAKRNFNGLENFPKSGPLILVGNHTGAMEVVMMAIYSPKQVEFMGAADLPWSGITGFFVEIYKIIPVHRGSTSKKTMQMGLDTLKQEGMLGVFPEGGFWEPGLHHAQTGAAWLSYKAQAPVLPIGFGDTRGTLIDLFKLKRPEFVMNVGKILPPVQLERGKDRKAALQKAADDIMDAVWELVPEDEKKKKSGIENEEFFFDMEIFDKQKKSVEIPADLTFTDGPWLSRFIHRINLIGTMRDDVKLPVQPLKDIHTQPPAAALLLAASSIVNYVEDDNIHYFTYRYGKEDGPAMHNSFHQFIQLMQWVIDNGYTVEAIARYEYTDPDTGEHRVRTESEEVSQW